MKHPTNFEAFEMDYTRPVEFQDILDLMVRLSGYTRRQPFVLEIRLTKNEVRYLLLSSPLDTPYLHKMMQVSNDIQFSKLRPKERKTSEKAWRVAIKRNHFSLKTDGVENFTRSFLALSHHLKPQEEICVQVVVGKSRPPQPLARDLSHLNATWWQWISGNIPKLSKDADKLIREKLRHAQFQADVRIGVRSDSHFRKNELYHTVLGAFRMLESSGVELFLNPISSEKVNKVQIPWAFPLTLSSQELASFWLAPIGEGELAGIANIHPKILRLPLGYKVPDVPVRKFGESIKNEPLQILPRDATQHLLVLGGTGVGKSTLLAQFILTDIQAGRSTLLIDPKGDLVREVLAHFPKERRADLVIIDPSSSNKIIGLNPFDLTRYTSPELVADMLLNLFQELFSDNWGIRTVDVLSHALTVMAQVENSNLPQLPQFLTNPVFRNQLLSQISDPFLLDFWQGYNQLSDANREVLISPVLNKIRQLLLRKELRAMLASTSKKFNLIELFTSKKVVLVNLNRGQIGVTNAKFIGSLITNYIYQLTLHQAHLAPENRPFLPIYIDELGQFLKLPVDLEDALAVSRSMKVGYILASQHLTQLPSTLRTSVLSNCRSKIIFTLEHHEAKELASQAPELTFEDFMTLAPFHFYAQMPIFYNHFKWVSGRSLPLSKNAQPIDELYAESLEYYGDDLANFENTPLQNKKDEIPPENLGRKKRGGQNGEN